MAWPADRRRDTAAILVLNIGKNRSHIGACWGNSWGIHDRTSKKAVKSIASGNAGGNDFRLHTCLDFRGREGACQGRLSFDWPLAYSLATQSMNTRTRKLSWRLRG